MPGIYRPPPYPHMGSQQPLQGRKLAPALLAVPEDSPVPVSGLRRLPAMLALVAAAWQPVYVRAQTAPHTPQPTTQVDQPTPNRFLCIVLRHWSDRQPLPQQPRHLPAALAAVPEDNPPFGLRQPYQPILCAWRPLPTTGWNERWASRKLTPPDVTVAADNPPVRSGQTLAAILSLWQPTPVPWQAPERVTPPSVDDPPFASAGRLPLAGIVDQWQARGAPQQRQRFLTSEQATGVDDPPFGLTGRLALAGILTQWQPRPVPQQPVERVTPASTDNPPFAARRPFGPVLLAWQVVPPQPILPRYQVQFFVAAVNDPPFGLRQPLWSIIRAWQPGPPSRAGSRAAYLPVSGPLVLPAPPSRYDFLSLSWVVGDGINFGWTVGDWVDLRRTVGDDLEDS